MKPSASYSGSQGDWAGRHYHEKNQLKALGQLVDIAQHAPLSQHCPAQARSTRSPLSFSLALQDCRKPLQVPVGASGGNCLRSRLRCRGDGL